MISLQKSTGTTPKCTPNLLPCRIHRDGPVDASPRYWSPEIHKDGKPEAYFRGRKLNGRAVAVPEGYRGAVVKEKAEPLQLKKQTERMTPESGLESEKIERESKILEEVGDFDQLMVWSHEAMAEGDDPFVKGVDEWISFATSIHAYDDSWDGSPRKND